MNKKFLNLFAALILVLSSFQMVACGGGNNDAAIQTKIASITQTNPEMQSVSAAVSEGVVTLVGQCKSEKDRERAEKAVKDIDDVKEVVNNITITENLVVTPDNELRENAADVLKKYKKVRADINGGIITLRGNIDKEDLPQLQMDLNALKPRRIDNQMVVE